jgi:hypothetical protein
MKRLQYPWKLVLIFLDREAKSSLHYSSDNANKYGWIVFVKKGLAFVNGG